jgi:hypothetical protein
MRKILLLFMFVSTMFVLAGCDYLDDDLINQIQDYRDDYCVENPDSEYCNLDYEAELEKAEEHFSTYFTDYSNPEITTEDLADKYFGGEVPEGFEEERKADLDAGTVLELIEIEFRLDGAFDVSYNAVTGFDKVVRKRPGRISFDAETETSTITWVNGEDNDCDDTCDDLVPFEDSTSYFSDYFTDYANKDITNEEFAKTYLGGRLSDDFAEQRTEDLEKGITITDVLLSVREDLYFDVTYTVTYASGEYYTRKRPGRVRYTDISLIIIWGEDEADVTETE